MLPLPPPYAISTDVGNPSSYGRIGKGASHKGARKTNLERERISSGFIGVNHHFNDSVGFDPQNQTMRARSRASEAHQRDLGREGRGRPNDFRSLDETLPTVQI
jgi:hypothetical protein